MTITLKADSRNLADLFFSELGSLGPARAAIIPGDPHRVDIVTGYMDDVETFDFTRGYRGASGFYQGQRIYVLSSGIGGAGFERTIVELSELGVDTVIRVGTTGALRRGIEPGDFIINEGSVRLDGTSTTYVRPEYPAAASWEVVGALVAEAKKSGVPYYTGIGATTASFFAGQGRPTFGGWAGGAPILEEMTRAGVVNFEMEAATLFTLARLFGVRAGSICAAINNRLEGSMGGKDRIPLACELALKAASALISDSIDEVRA